MCPIGSNCDPAGASRKRQSGTQDGVPYRYRMAATLHSDSRVPAGKNRHCSPSSSESRKGGPVRNPRQPPWRKRLFVEDDSAWSMVTPESDAAGATDWRTAQFDRPKATGGDWPHEFQNCFNVSLCNWVVVTGPRGLFFFIRTRRPSPRSTRRSFPLSITPSSFSFRPILRRSLRSPAPRR